MSQIIILVGVLLCWSCAVGTAVDYFHSCDNQGRAVSVLYDNSTQEYDSLQDAINQNIQAKFPIVVCLSQGHHLISKQILFSDLSIALIGSQNTSIECGYNALPFFDGLHYTWHFNQSNFIHFQNVEFTNCPYPFRLIAVQKVTVRDCIFRNFSEAVFDFFNCESIQMFGSLFFKNSGTGILFEKFRGNTGAVAIGYNNYPHFLNQPNVTIKSCNFINNRASGTASKVLSSERTLSNRVFTGRGGGIGMYIGDSSDNVVFEIIQSKFIGNYARLFGGGIYINANSHGTWLQLYFEQIDIVGNTAGSGGGGVLLALLSNPSIQALNHTAYFKDCNFIENVGDSGGGIYVFTSFIGNQGITLENSTFTKNSGNGNIREFGAAIAFSVLAIFQQRVTAQKHEVINCTFSGNSGRNGIVSIGYYPVKFSGTNMFKNNVGASIRVVGIKIDLFDKIIFINNSDLLEGSLSILSFGQVRIHKGLHIVFNGNTGRLGASITVATPDTLSAFSNLLYNSACFAIFEDPLISPLEWENVRVEFEKNKAVLGSALYFSRIGHCTWYSETPPFFKETILSDWPIWMFGNDTNSGYPDSHNPTHSIRTSAIKISPNVDVINSWPGKKFRMSITGIDQFEKITSINAHLFEISKSTPSIEFNPGIIVVAGSSTKNGLLSENFSMTYTVLSENGFHNNSSPLPIGIRDPFNRFPITTATVTLRTEPCPGGYKLMSSGVTVLSTTHWKSGLQCECIDIPEIIGCEEDQDSIILKDGYWARFVSSQTPNIFLYPCPPGYCQCSLHSSLGPERCVFMYTHSSPNSQCSEQRTGLLCGSCKDKKGVSVLLNGCVSCSNAFITLLIGLILSDVAVLIVIILIDRPIPDWIYPFMFYIQMAAQLSQQFPKGFTFVAAYMTYANSALGLYFVYDFCLLKELPPLASYFLRYIPLLISLTVVSSLKIVRYCLKKKFLKHNGYWIITLLLYSNLANTSFSILNCPKLPDMSRSFSHRWFVDASIACFSGWHIPLALFSILVLVCLVSIPVAVIAIQIVKKPGFMRTYMVPTTTAYKQECHWWAGIDLGRRLLLLLFVTLFPKNTVFTILLLVLILSAYSYLLPYKSKVANAVETFLLFNLVVMMLFDATPLIKQSLLMFSKENSSEKVNWLLLVLFYFPLLLLIAGVTISLIPLVIRVVRYCKKVLKRHPSTVVSTNTSVPNAENLNVSMYTQSVLVSVPADFEGEIDMISDVYHS